MKELTPKEKLIVNEWKKRQEQHEQAKQKLKDVLGKYGIASSEFNAARVEFEMLKEEFDNFEKENRDVLADYR
jgi:polyhydroxyalkanoate synthesis regulator phasin